MISGRESGEEEEREVERVVACTTKLYGAKRVSILLSDPAIMYRETDRTLADCSEDCRREVKQVLSSLLNVI